MKRMNLKNYDISMGELIDLSNPLDYMEKHDARAVSIPYQKLMMNYDKYLKKDRPYYLICAKGMHSGKAVMMLEYLGYDVTQVMY